MQNNTYKVSCIMPIHNSERYLETTLTSLLEQTLTDIEIICVDDCSDDGSLQILQKKADKDERIKCIINKEKKGAAVSRNKGLNIAQGEYVIFLDSDDYFYPNMLEKAYGAAKSQEADLVVFGIEWVNVTLNENNQEIYSYKRKNSMKYEEVLKNQVNIDVLGKVSVVPWNKLVQRKLLIENKIKFQDIPANNDMFYSVAVVLNANKIILLDKVLIRYFYGRQDSLTATRNRKKLYVIDVYEALYNYVSRHKNINLILIDLINYFLNALQVLFENEGIEESVRTDVYAQLCDSKILYSALNDSLENNLLLKHNKEFILHIMQKKNVIGVDSYFYYANEIRKIVKEQKDKRKKIALWGCGVKGKKFIDMLNNEKIQIDHVIDMDVNKQGTIYGNYLIQSYSKVKEDVDMIFVFGTNMKNEILKVTEGKIIIDVNKL